MASQSAQDTILVVDRENLLAILRQVLVICDFVNDLISTLEFVNSLDKLILRHWIGKHFKVILAPNDHLHGRPPNVLNYEILSDCFLREQGRQINEPMRDLRLQLLHLLVLLHFFLPSLSFLALGCRLSSFLASTGLASSLACFGLLFVLVLVFVATATPFLAILVCRGLLLRRNDSCEFLIARHLLALVFLLRVGRGALNNLLSSI